jgi:cation diffusion facilitator CzcD-associated flavoprotein CzcO
MAPNNSAAHCDAFKTPLLNKIQVGVKTVRTVGIIGGGVSGIVTARILLEEGIDCNLFECTSQLGGVWAENYVGFGIQVPSALYEFPDEPLPEGWDFCSGPRICGYIQQYAQKHGVTEIAKFNTRVLGIASTSTGGYDVTYEDKSGIHTKSFDIVVVATGVYGKQDKFIPNWDGKETFGGQIIHCADYLDLAVSEGKHVISVGYGKSSFDCAQVSVPVAKSSTILFREAHWCVPRKILGLVPFEFATFSRFGAACLQPMYAAAGPIEKLLHAIPLILTLFWQLVAFIFQKQFGMPKQCIPEKGFIADFWGGHGILPHPDFFPLINAGSIKAIKGEIKTIKENSVVLASGDELPCDVIVAATGYKPIRSFLPAEVADLKEKDGFWLYRQMVHPSHPGLIFLNSETTTFTNITTASIQARWLAEMLAGTFELPSARDMQAQIEEMQEWKRSTMPNAGAARAYMIQTHQVHYYDQLLKDMGASVRRKQGFAAAIKEVFDPYRPRDFGSIITGEFKNRPREQAKPGDAQAPFWMEGLMVIAALLAFCVAFRILFSGIQVELAPLR